LKFSSNAFFCLVLILAVLLTARNIIIRAGLQQGMRISTGLRLNIDKLEVGLLQPVINIKNSTLSNPSGYTDPVMADVGEIHLRYKPVDMLKGHIYLKDLRITLRELFIIRGRGNQLNYDALKTFRSGRYGPSSQLTIDDFSLNIGKVVYKDYTHVPSPLVKVYNLDLSEHYSGIHGTDDLERLIMVGILNKTSISSLIKVDLNKLGRGISGTLLNTLKVSDNSLQGLLDNL
jgi:hypothetical protein